MRYPELQADLRLPTRLNRRPPHAESLVRLTKAIALEGRLRRLGLCNQQARPSHREIYARGRRLSLPRLHRSSMLPWLDHMKNQFCVGGCLHLLPSLWISRRKLVFWAKGIANRNVRLTLPYLFLQCFTAMAVVVAVANPKAF